MNKGQTDVHTSFNSCVRVVLVVSLTAKDTWSPPFSSKMRPHVISERGSVCVSVTSKRGALPQLCCITGLLKSEAIWSGEKVTPLAPIFTCKGNSHFFLHFFKGLQIKQTQFPLVPPRLAGSNLTNVSIAIVISFSCVTEMSNVGNSCRRPMWAKSEA